MLYFAPGERGGVPVLPPGVDDGSWSRGGVFTSPPRSTPPIITSPDVPTRPIEPGVPPQYRAIGKPSPSFCAGLEDAVCGEGTGPQLFGNFGGPGTNDLCRASMSIICLVVGIAVLLAMLALATNALLRG